MWIAEFAQRAGVRPSTVRHYVREGLLVPKTGVAGGSRPYLEFTEADLRLFAAIRAGQSLGMALDDIKLLVAERRAGNGRTKLLSAMRQQCERLRRNAAELEKMLGYLERKIAWLEAGARGPAPLHNDEAPPGPVACQPPTPRQGGGGGPGTGPVRGRLSRPGVSR